MTSNTRLKLSAIMIMISAVYGVLVAQSPSVASAVSSGYVALLLTVFIVSNLGKKP